MLAWLDHIGETDPATIAEVLTACRSDPDALAYFAGSAARGMPKIAAPVAGAAVVSARI